MFQQREGFYDLPVEVPCGKCRGCLLERSRQWAVRCTHEASLWRKNVFVTLTYSSANVAKTEAGLFTLRPGDFVLFMKRLRKRRVAGVRFLQSGEYGSLGRPHHHALLFNCDFPDKVFLGKSKRGVLFRSKELEELWPLGYSSIGEVTFESAAYVARYTLKKFGCGSGGGGSRVGSEVAGEALSREPEYMTMSRRPGIGAGWFEKYGSDCFPSDELVVRGGKRMRPPRFYLERLAEGEREEVKRKRVAAAGLQDGDEVWRRRGADARLVHRRVDDYLRRSMK